MPVKRSCTRLRPGQEQWRQMGADTLSGANVLFGFYYDEPDRINPALYWIRVQMNPLMDEPYNQEPKFMNTAVVIHATENVTVARKN